VIRLEARENRLFELVDGEVLPGFTLPVRQLFAEPTEGPDHQQAL
jgi:hypothetical protein